MRAPHPRRASGGAAPVVETGSPGLRTGSLRVRTVVAVLLLLTVLLGALAVTVELTLGQRLRAQVVDRLTDRAAAAASLVGTVDGDELAERLSAQGLSVVIEDADGGEIVAGPSPEQLRAGPPALGSDGPLGGPGQGPDRGGAGSDASTAPVDDAAGADDTTRSSSAVAVSSSEVSSDDEVTTLVSRLSDGSTITLSTDSRSVGETLTQLRWVMLGASAAFLLVAAAGLALVVRATLRPLDRMTAVARSIASGDRGRRLRPARRDTEIGRVALAFDEMLDGVEGAERTALEAESRVRAFVSDAAHELRTPVAGMRAAADTLVRSPPSDADRERLAVHVVREAERASRLIDDMLLMARVDRGVELDLEVVDVEAIVRADAERLRVRRPGLDLRVVRAEAGVGTVSGAAGSGSGSGSGSGPGSGSAPVLAAVDAGRISQIVGNLLDNAARATGGTGRVTVEIEGVGGGEGRSGESEARREAGTGTGSGSGNESGTGTVTVTVRDDGPGVPGADRERVFERLVRLDVARRSGDGGAGLGLPIARGLARAHGGDLVCVEPGPDTGLPGGAVFVLTLPVGGTAPLASRDSCRGQNASRSMMA
ncbi:HAMP domain-containing sensor histidine kinase [Frigoribacterium sp. Leaf172]|uniref:HAMP domain-containing sensor histidine kinase n=1 Tax=Frigoribacterium sp. Leaf172 TaxID=1736285 RepID=UPI0009E68DDF|nr:HAMP domain-containing sensor histidine kinase [Frigoribacterium sp. Leaf172]